VGAAAIKTPVANNNRVSVAAPRIALTDFVRGLIMALFYQSSTIFILCLGGFSGSILLSRTGRFCWQREGSNHWSSGYPSPPKLRLKFSSLFLQRSFAILPRVRRRRFRTDCETRYLQF
jgi:hypothetical protein